MERTTMSVQELSAQMGISLQTSRTIVSFRITLTLYLFRITGGMNGTGCMINSALLILSM